MPMKARYSVVDGGIIAEKRSGVRKEYLPDPLGSTVALLNSSQSRTDTFTYWPYGEVNTRSGTTTTPFQFVGTQGYYSDTIGNTYVRARYLDSQKGRWLTKHPIGYDGEDWNLCRYSANAPTAITDPTGLQMPMCNCGCHGYAGCCPGIKCRYWCPPGTVQKSRPIPRPPIIIIGRPFHNPLPPTRQYWGSYLNCVLLSNQPNNCPTRTSYSTRTGPNQPASCPGIIITQ
jgi:RHS repeat-associated protein